MGPGQTLFTRIPRGVSSCAAVNANPRTAHFEAPYAERPGEPEYYKNTFERTAVIHTKYNSTYV